jgi:selenocysteine lyase/cysteine desulfurase
VDATELRAEFPVLERLAYMNSGTQGPVPARAAAAATREVEREAEEGRGGMPHFERLFSLGERLRGRLAGLLACEVDEVALTHSTTDGMNAALTAVELGPGDEVLTSDEEHPGLLGPLAAHRARRGFDLRVAPFAELGNAIGPRTKLVACSHVSWVNGQVADTAALAASDALVLLDGAQGLGAIPTPMRELGCDFYGAAGQKWLCGPDGTGCLYVRGELCPELPVPWPSYSTLEDPSRPLESAPKAGARRFDLGFSAPLWAWSLAALDVLEAVGWDAIRARGPSQAARLADSLRERGAEVAPRGRSTLVSWHSEDARAEALRLGAAGVLVREIPRTGMVRASVGAWSSDEDLDRLLAAREAPG